MSEIPMGQSVQTLMTLVDLIYEAALDPSLWEVFLTKLGKTLDIPWCFFFVHDLSQQKVDIQAAVGFDSARVRSYQKYYAARNPTFIRGQAQLWPGNVCRTEALCPKDVFEKSELHNDWSVPQGIGQGIGAVVLKTPTQVGLFGMLQRINGPAPSEIDLALLRLLMPHMQRAVKFHGQLVGLRMSEGRTREALDRMIQGVVFLDRRGQVLWMNRAAESTVKKGDVISLGRTGIQMGRPDEQGKWAVLLRRTLSGVVQATTPGGEMKVSREHSKQPLSVSVTPLTFPGALVSEPLALCVVFISDPDSMAIGDERRLQLLYGFTAAQARVATRLVDGCTVKEIDEGLKVGKETVRTHIRQILEKTHTRRQAELVGVLLRGALSLQRQ